MVRSMGSFRCGIRETFTQGRSYVASARAPSCTAGAGAGVGAGSSSMGSAISTALHTAAPRTRHKASRAPQDGLPALLTSLWAECEQRRSPLAMAVDVLSEPVLLLLSLALQ